MNQIILSDELLKSAAQLAHEKWISSFPEPEECGHEFPEGFYESILRDAERLARGKRILRRVAAAILALLIGGAILLAVNPSARAAFLAWVREITGGHATYHFVSDSPLTEVPHYKLSYIPEGFEESEEMRDSGYSLSIYTNVETGQMVAFEYSLIFEGNYTAFISPNAEKEMIPELIIINGLRIDFYPADEYSNTNGAIWFDNNAQIMFTVSGNIEKSVIISIIEGVVLDKTTK